MVVFACPSCHQAMQVPPELAGQAVTCPFCRNTVMTPPLAAPAAPARTKSGPPLDLDDCDDLVEEEERAAQKRKARQLEEQRQYATGALRGGLALLAVAVVCGALMIPGARTASAGSRPITADELLGIKDPNKAPDGFVTFIPEQALVDTGVAVEARSRGSSRIKSRYFLVPVKDRWLIVEREADATGNRLEGKLANWTSGLAGESVQKIKGQYPDKKDKMLPVQLDATGGSPANRLLWMGVVLAMFGLSGLGGVIYGLTTMPPKRRR